MNNMGNFKEKVMETLIQHSLSSEDMEFWSQMLGHKKLKQMPPELQDLFIEGIQRLKTEDIRFYTDYFKQIQEAARNHDENKLKEADEKEEKYLKAYIKQGVEEKHLFCLKKAQESINENI